MKKSILFLIYLLNFFQLIAQGSKQDLKQYYIENAKACGGVDSIFARKGHWKKDADAIIFPDATFPKSQFTQLNSRLDKMSFLFKEALPDLSGFEAKWYRVIDGTSYVTNGAVPYEFSSLYLTYFCIANKKQIALGDETGTWAYVYVNHLGWLCDKLDDWNIRGDGKMITVYSLAPKVGEWKGTTLYAPRTHDAAHAVVVTHNKKLPWHALTRQEYLTGLKNKWQTELQTQLAGYDESEEKMKHNLDNLPATIKPNEAEKIKAQLLQQLKDFQSKKEQFKSNSQQFYGQEIKYIDDYEQTASEETLGQAAIIDPKYGALKFRGVFGEEERGGTRLIAISSGYFDKDLPRYVPQFMVLYWRWTQDPVSLRFRDQFEGNFPLQKLREFIDK